VAAGGPRSCPPAATAGRPPASQPHPGWTRTKTTRRWVGCASLARVRACACANANAHLLQATAERLRRGRRVQHHQGVHRRGAAEQPVHGGAGAGARRLACMRTCMHARWLRRALRASGQGHATLKPCLKPAHTTLQPTPTRARAGQPVDVRVLGELHQEAGRAEQALQVRGHLYHHAEERWVVDRTCCCRPHRLHYAPMGMMGTVA